MDRVESNSFSLTSQDPSQQVHARAAGHYRVRRGPGATRSGETLERVRIQAPFLLRTFEPPLESVFGKTVRSVRRLGKRIAVGLDDDLWLVIHLMIAGRLVWKPRGAKLGAKIALAAFDFPKRSLVLTEAGSKRRASLHILRGEEALRPGPGWPRAADRELCGF